MRVALTHLCRVKRYYQRVSNQFKPIVPLRARSAEYPIVIGKAMYLLVMTLLVRSLVRYVGLGLKSEVQVFLPAVRQCLDGQYGRIRPVIASLRSTARRKLDAG
jgi:hypothetical protein